LKSFYQLNDCLRTNELFKQLFFIELKTEMFNEKAKAFVKINSNKMEEVYEKKIRGLIT
jgi:hypothetical protein